MTTVSQMPRFISMAVYLPRGWGASTKASAQKVNSESCESTKRSLAFETVSRQPNVILQLVLGSETANGQWLNGALPLVARPRPIPQPPNLAQLHDQKPQEPRRLVAPTIRPTYILKPL